MLEYIFAVDHSTFIWEVGASPQPPTQAAAWIDKATTIGKGSGFRV